MESTNGLGSEGFSPICLVRDLLGALTAGVAFALTPHSGGVWLCRVCVEVGALPPRSAPAPLSAVWRGRGPPRRAAPSPRSRLQVCGARAARRRSGPERDASPRGGPPAPRTLGRCTEGFRGRLCAKRRPSEKPRRRGPCPRGAPARPRDGAGQRGREVRFCPTRGRRGVFGVRNQLASGREGRRGRATSPCGEHGAHGRCSSRRPGTPRPRLRRPDAGCSRVVLGWGRRGRALVRSQGGRPLSGSCLRARAVRVRL